MKAKGITYMSMVEELPITLKNSHLTQLLLAEMRYNNAEKPVPPTALEIAPRCVLLKTFIRFKHFSAAIRCRSACAI